MLQLADGEASDGKTTHSFSNDEFMAGVNRLKDQQTATQFEYLRFLNNAFGQTPQPKAPPKWESIDEMMASLAKQKAAAPKPVIPAVRRAEIEAELDIIRGRVPTPKGYILNPLRAKELMFELKQLPT